MRGEFQAPLMSETASYTVGHDELAVAKLLALDGAIDGEVKVSCSGLAGRLDASTQTASRRLQRLEDAGYISRETVSDGQWVQLTDEGERTDATTAENAPAGATGAPTDATDRSAGQITLGRTDLTATTGLLALVTPYAVHVALRLQTALAFSVAFGSAFLLVAAAGVRLTVWRIAMDDGADTIDRGADSATTAPDGGREDAP